MRRLNNGRYDGPPSAIPLLTPVMLADCLGLSIVWTDNFIFMRSPRDGLC
jgi:hypothetical protein